MTTQTSQPVDVGMAEGAKVSLLSSGRITAMPIMFGYALVFLDSPGNPSSHENEQPDECKRRAKSIHPE